MTKPRKTPTKRETKSDPSESYDEFKEFEGQRYTGMAIGRSHKWYYDQGVWKDRKITPDLWEISYAVTKRRAGRAPEGSGAAVGTEYHWYILAHQKVCKLNANDYTTSMTGLKFKVAHKRGGGDKWSVTERGKRKRIIKFLRDVLADLEAQEEAVSPVRKKAESSATATPETSAKSARSTRSAGPARPKAPKSMRAATKRARKAPGRA